MPLLLLLAADPHPVVSTDQAPQHTILSGQGTATLLHNATTGSTRAALTLLTLAAGAEVPEHQHPDSDELLYVLEGSTTVTLGGQTYTLTTGDAVLIPAGVPHRATATTALRALQVYAAPGPEQRFTAGPKVR